MTFAFLQGALFAQIGKFVVTGLINTGIDFAVLTVLIKTTRKNKGYWIMLFSAISFIVASINSFLLNKFWTFSNKGADYSGQATKFFFVSIGGLIINSGITWAVSNFFPPFLGLFSLSSDKRKNQDYWVLFGKAAATGVSLIWNFIGYKLWVF
jgi:putative flippase GtrA